MFQFINLGILRENTSMQYGYKQHVNCIYVIALICFQHMQWYMQINCFGKLTVSFIGQSFLEGADGASKQFTFIGIAFTESTVQYVYC
jgi:hypothetical protein